MRNASRGTNRCGDDSKDERRAARVWVRPRSNEGKEEETEGWKKVDAIKRVRIGKLRLASLPVGCWSSLSAAQAASMFLK